jgi:protein-S-isoprenylcysteine O-methyltransferase Ste14
MRVLLTIGWIAGVAYSTVPTLWLMVHSRARRLGAMSREPLPIVGLVWAVPWIVIAGVTYPWRGVRLYSSKLAWIAGAALIATGLAIYAMARREFSTDQLLGRPELQPDRHEQRLVVGGIRARVRHPYYLGHLCELLGWTLGTGLAVLYVLLVFTIVTGAWMIRLEERELVERFGESYVEYRRRVPPLWPKFKSSSLRTRG